MAKENITVNLLLKYGHEMKKVNNKPRNGCNKIPLLHECVCQPAAHAPLEQVPFSILQLAFW